MSDAVEQGEQPAVEMSREGGAPTVCRGDDRVERPVDSGELVRNGALPVGLVRPSPIEQPCLHAVLGEGSRGRALRTEVEYPRTDREAGDHEHRGGDRPLARESEQ